MVNDSVDGSNSDNDDNDEDDGGGDNDHHYGLSLGTLDFVVIK